MPATRPPEPAGPLPPHPAQHSPATERNRGPILAALLDLLPAQGQALEIASGTGQHVAYFGAHLPGWRWQPSDCTADAFESVAAWCAYHGAGNVQPPVVIDVTQPQWPATGPALPAHGLDLVYCANMLHISPWETCAGLMRGAAHHLSDSGRLVTYGPYLEHGVPTAPSNLAFDASLRRRHPSWGLRSLEDVGQQARAAGLRLARRLPMPANNLLLVWEPDKAA